jgi:hypothetical protein
MDPTCSPAETWGGMRRTSRPVFDKSANLESSAPELGRILQETLTLNSSLAEPLLTPDLLFELNKTLNANPFNPVDAGPADSRLDREASDLWNTCTSMSVSCGNNPEHLRVLAKVKALAYALLNSSQASDLLGLCLPC